MKVLVTGGNGYVGSVLLPRLIENEISVRNIDAQWFGNFLPDAFNQLTQIKTIDQIDENDLKDVDHVIHLANVANDPSVELNPSFSWEINTLDLAKLLDTCKTKSRIKSFIYASSGSVYGFSDAEKVTEEVPLIPISAYNKTKQIAERVCLSYKDYFNVHIVRPATVCGISPRMRFDVVVNMFVLQAYSNSKITILGGEQIRPNIHISDMATVYLHFLKNYHLPSGFFNAGFENLSITQIAERIQRISKCEFEVLSSNDPRSYRLDSTKLLQTGFKPNFSVDDAIEEVFLALKDNKIKNDPRFHTVSWMKSAKIGIKNEY